MAERAIEARCRSHVAPSRFRESKGLGERVVGSAAIRPQNQFLEAH